MAQLSKEQRVFLVSKYLELKDYNQVLIAFTERFPERRTPCKKSIAQNVKKYLEHGTSLNLNKQFSGRPRTQRTLANIEAVRRELGENPRNFSIRRNNLDLAPTTLHRIIKEDLKWHPYRMLVRHKLEPADFERRMNFCRWFDRESRNPRFLRRVVIGDEACFSMDGRTSTQNVRMYAPQGNRPDFTYERDNSRQKLTVWVGLCGNGSLIGPYFFEGSVTGRKYLEMLNNYVFQTIAASYLSR